ncbi:hypothetical protein AAV94_11835 [Lampropedia cohaerens]|uniref:Bile acid:sodium symporter n=1 Tax=Lampropedia cohaerens TaxID=1610491 RepID=A0A0U1PXJ8_9BURK|nr:hypothetical protein [Lampropedia cohaerens]KKW67220.1 hypothetical protein AAV94_11835 [Lampropedia cohaerens]
MALIPSRDWLERNQLLCYLLAIALGWLLGVAQPQWVPVLDALGWPLLAALLFATFAQTPVAALPQALRNRPLLLTLLIGNFVAIPLVVAMLLPLAGPLPAVQLAVVLVLCVPCTDWFITFTASAGGDVPSAVAWTPLSLLLQLLLLPLYAHWLLQADVAQLLWQPRVIGAAVLLILLPLTLAWLLQRCARGRPMLQRRLAQTGWWPVPLLALVIVLAAAGQPQAIMQAHARLWQPLLVFALFAALTVPLAWLLARLARLPMAQSRTLLISLATRNSFVMLPLAWALGDAFALTRTTIVLQSVVELLAIVLLAALARRLFP